MIACLYVWLFFAFTDLYLFNRIVYTIYVVLYVCIQVPECRCIIRQKGVVMITSNVKKLMEERKVTIRGLVALTGLSDKTILRARSGRIVECRLYTLQTIARHLDCTIVDLFTVE